MLSALMSDAALPTSYPPMGELEALKLPYPLLGSDVLSIGMPSTMISGWFCPRIELAPRTTMRAEPNGLAEFVTCTPATLPCSADTTFCVGTSDSRLPETVCAAYER